MDVRHEEFIAMAEVYLGKDFDKAKLMAVENWQNYLHDTQESLVHNYFEHNLDASTYVDQSNALAEVVAMRCEDILGPDNFYKLFGSTVSDFANLIDKETFIESEKKFEINEKLTPSVFSANHF